MSVLKKMKTSVSTYDINKNKINITGLTGHLTGVKLYK